MSEAGQPSDFDRECDVRPPGTAVQCVRGNGDDHRPWLADAPIIPALDALGIAHAGVLTAPRSFHVVRTRLSGAYFTATLSGVGRVFLNGSWRECRPGHAVLLMPGVLNALQTHGDEPWRHCWVRIAAGADVLRGPADRMQVVTPWEAEPLLHALLGLRSAALYRGSPALLQRWAELVLESVHEFCHSHAPDPRIARLWEAVEIRLAQPWSIGEMSAVASLSPEHLRRLSRKATGRAPHAHLMHLRMKRAAELLLTTEWTLERIAETVGYASAFAFSAAFKKVIGWPPSSYAHRDGRVR